MNGNPSSPKDASPTSVVPEGGKPARAARDQATPEGLVPHQAAERPAPGRADVPAAGDSPRPEPGAARGHWPRRLRPDVLRAYWLSPAGLVILAATGLSLALRLFMLSRPDRKSVV